ncbi:MAG: hypothetical protein LBV01_01440 [Deltaproteobacteria bacterium]|jgi:hypothetical protein|nr:hypothetical protein [Deltaproteobacteria bacterium]
MKRIALLALCVLFLLPACKSSFNTAEIETIDQRSFGVSLTKEQAAKAITQAGSRLGWQIRQVSTGLLEGTLRNRQHLVVVDIPYTAKEYSIKYKSSSDNMYSEDGKIHKSYNRWVRNLEKEIGIAAQMLK